VNDFLLESFNQAPVAMLITDHAANIQAVNQAYCKLTGYTPTQIVGATPRLMKSGRHNKDFYDTLWTELTATNKWSGEIWDRHKSGRVYAAQVTINAVLNEENAITNYVAVLTDITARKRDQERASRIAHADTLTGLPDQTLFLDRLDQITSRFHRDKKPAAIGIIDIDGFKTINGSFGFDAGDELLREIALRIKTTVRDSDTVARFEGDQFAVILPDLAHQRDAALIAKKLLARLSDTYDLGRHRSAFVTVSVGLALLPTDSTDVGGLIRCADMARSQAKSAGRNIFSFYSKTMNAAALQRLHLERDLHSAVQNHDFELHFQPIVSTRDSALTAAEALIRWKRPGHGLVSPLDFLPLAEETGLIVPIGDWVLQEVVDCLIACHAKGAPSLRISVNISPRQLRDSEIFERVRQRLAAADIPPDSLVLEIAESALQDITRAEETVLQKIASFGIALSIDNYSAGYTSLQHLRRMQITSLKIDKVFIRNMASDPTDTTLADAILTMAHSLGIRTIADGIETADQWQLMRDKNCDFAQGYLFSKPLTKEEFLIYVRNYYGKVS